MQTDRPQAPERADQPRSGTRTTGLGTVMGRQFPESGALIAFVVILGAIFTALSPYFLQWQNFLDILTAMAIVGIVAAPGTYLIISGNFDLSVGSGVAFCSVVFAVVAQHHGLAAGILVSLGCGLLIGLVNGFVVTILGVNSLITTLGTLGVLGGLAEVLAKGNNIAVNNFTTLGSGRPFLRIPIPVLFLIGILLIFGLGLRYTVFGRAVYAIGSNQIAARLVGIPTRATVFSAFVLSGFCVWLGAIILTSQTVAGSPTAESTLELTVITAIVIGGTALEGGKGSMVGTAIGILLLGVISNGLTLLNVNTFWQDVTQGALLIAAVAFDRLRLKLSGRGG